MDIQNFFAERIGGSAFGTAESGYKFALIKKWKKEAQGRFGNNMPLIDMGVGEPDLPANSSIADVLSAECIKAENRFYADNGIEQFQNAAIGYMKNVFGVNNLTLRNVIHGIGSKSILAMLPSCFINSGDYLLQTVPGYPIMTTNTQYLGGRVFDMPLKEENNFYPDFAEIPKSVCQKAKLMYINYPNNPTGQTATKDFFERVVDFAKSNNIIVVHDAAYAALTYGEKPLSFLSVRGAMEVGVEVHSLSKSFNMTGWRLAFVAGNEKIVSAFGAVKDNTDSGQFRAIQLAGAYALQNPNLAQINVERYSKRLDLLVKALNNVGVACRKPKGTFYCYVKAPVGTKNGVGFKNAVQAARYILLNANISVVPWDESGSYLRFSATFSTESLSENDVITGLENRLNKLELRF